MGSIGERIAYIANNHIDPTHEITDAAESLIISAAVTRSPDFFFPSFVDGDEGMHVRPKPHAPTQPRPRTTSHRQRSRRGMGPPASHAADGGGGGSGPSIETLRFLHAQVQVRSPDVSELY